jgi:hypothetical protein
MKASELIKFLQGLDPEMVVMVPGYEGGYRYVDPSAGSIEMALNVHSKWYYGPHEEANDHYSLDPDRNYEIVNAIVL